MAPMDRAEALIRLARARSGHLGTVRPDGKPHVVVVTFAAMGGSVVTAIDHKPKRTQRLQRLVNIEANRSASLLVDHYDEDWDGLWWVRLDGPASIHRTGELWSGAVDALVDKYPQYRERPPEGPVIVIAQDRVTWWDGTR